jgi:hypothetical protein
LLLCNYHPATAATLRPFPTAPHLAQPAHTQSLVLKMPSLPPSTSLLIHSAGLIGVFAVYGLCVSLGDGLYVLSGG